MLCAEPLKARCLGQPSATDMHRTCRWHLSRKALFTRAASPPASGSSSPMRAARSHHCRPIPSSPFRLTAASAVKASVRPSFSTPTADSEGHSAHRRRSVRSRRQPRLFVCGAAPATGRGTGGDCRRSAASGALFAPLFHCPAPSVFRCGPVSPRSYLSPRPALWPPHRLTAARAGAARADWAALHRHRAS